MWLFTENLRTCVGIQKKTACICVCKEKTCLQKGKEGKMIGQDQNYSNQTLKGKPASRIDTKTQRTESNSSTLCTQSPNNKQGTSLVESQILLRRETLYVLGCTTTDWMTPEINHFQYARAIKAYNTKGYESYLIPDGWCRSPLCFSNHACIPNSLSTTTNKTHMLYIQVLGLL